MTTRQLRTLSAAAVLGSALCAANMALASAGWTGGGANNNWSTNGNWASGWGPTIFPSGTDVDLNTSSTGLSVVDAPYSIGYLKFANTLPSSFTLSGSTLTVAGGITTQYTGHTPYVVNNNIAIAGGNIVSGYSEGLQFGGNISGSAITFQASGLATSEIMAGGSVGTSGGDSNVTLDGTISWWGNSVIVLQLNSNAAIDDTANLFLVDGSGAKNGLLSLNFTSGLKETVASLTINGTLMSTGTYGATGSGATNIDDAHFTGTGMLQVGAVPEPASLSLFGLVAGMVLIRRRRLA